jgi:uridine kinase
LIKFPALYSKGFSDRMDLSDIKFQNSNLYPYLIGIAGGSASGKTYFLREIRNCFSENEVCIISQDNYYRPVNEQQKDEQGEINFDLPEGIDDVQFLKDITNLGTGKLVHREEYMFNQEGVKSKIITMQPAPVIITEGIFLFHFHSIKKMLDLKIFLDSRDDIKLKRRLQRDFTERGIAEEVILYQWHHHVIPAYNRFLLPYRDEADVILTNNESFKKGFELIRDHVATVIEKMKKSKLHLHQTTE